MHQSRPCSASGQAAPRSDSGAGAPPTLSAGLQLSHGSFGVLLGLGLRPSWFTEPPSFRLKRG
eukprot:8835036-Alexandrium_andersonii.AAC.1